MRVNPLRQVFGRRRPITQNAIHSEWRFFDSYRSSGVKSGVRLAGRNVIFRFHELKGDRKGTYSITVTANVRITFGFNREDATDADLEDYH